MAARIWIGSCLPSSERPPVTPGFMVRTLHGAFLATSSVTLPSSRWRAPLRPCVAMTIRVDVVLLGVVEDAGCCRQAAGGCRLDPRRAPRMSLRQLGEGVVRRELGGLDVVGGREGLGFAGGVRG